MGFNSSFYTMSVEKDYLLSFNSKDSYYFFFSSDSARISKINADNRSPDMNGSVCFSIVVPLLSGESKWPFYPGGASRKQGSFGLTRMIYYLACCIKMS
jgi:hypothetical protein